MIYTNEIIKPEIAIETNQKWEDPFKTLLDEIYYPGYAETLAEEYPEQYQTEYYYFLSLYNHPIQAE